MRRYIPRSRGRHHGLGVLLDAARNAANDRGWSGVLKVALRLTDSGRSGQKGTLFAWEVSWTMMRTLATWGSAASLWPLAVRLRA